MIPKDTYSVAPVKVITISPQAVVVYKALRWLEKRQNRDGSWGKGSALDRIIATCHALMALLSCGYPSDHKAIVRGINWLTKGDVNQHLWSFWRIGPMLKLPGYEKYIENDLKRIKELINGHTAPHPDFLPQIFLLKVMLLLGRTKDDPEVQRYLKMVLDEWNEEICWRNRSDTTSHALAIINEFDFPNKERVVSASKRLIRLKASEIGPNHLCWEGRGTSTAYVIMNFIDSGFRDDPDLTPLMAKAVNWLADKQQPEGNWDIEIPPFGGTGDITSPDYYTAVIVRSIVAFNCARNPNFLLEVMWLKCYQLAKERQRLIRYIRFIVIVLGTISALIVWLYREEIAKITGSLLPMVWSTVTVLVAMAETIRTIIGWIKERK
jgi:hypothetical protein